MMQNTQFERNWTIYKIVSPSGRVYIGKTSSFKKRMTSYKNGATARQPRLYRSFLKYGYDNHIVSIVEEFYGGNDYADDKEMFWIRSFMSNICKYPQQKGLNLTDGGQGIIGYKATEELKKRLSDIHKANPTRGFLGWKQSESAKQKLSNAYYKNPPPTRKGTKANDETKRKQSLAKKGKPSNSKGIKYSDERRKQMSDSRKGIPNFKRRGIKMSEESIKKMSDAKKGKVAHNKGKKMPAHQVEMIKQRMKGHCIIPKGTKFDHLTEDERNKRFGSHNIGHTRNRGRKQSAEVVEARRLKQIGVPNVKLYKPINQYTIGGEFIKEFPSIKQAAIDLNIPLGTINDNLLGRVKNPKTFRFQYKAA